ncbi:MAG TPA: J domain-containing protein [Spirochaetia bacterium]|nr:J domain-containing protein [Spirochaetia bacterium]
MDGFLDKFAEFLRSLFSDDQGTSTGRARGAEKSTGYGGAEEARFRDPDVQSAWEELDDYMRGAKKDPGTGPRQSQSRRPERPVDESLRPDYANLEVPFGADMSKVMASYKSLILKYHPDKHAGDPEKQKIALDITKRINQSYERIRSRQGGPSS